jgi:DNA-binding GntR family transcriptional regulator
LPRVEGATTQRQETANTGEQAYRTLLRLIETAELRPGTPIVEREHAAALGMSRTPFREALHRLQLDGLVQREPKRGTYVSHLDAQDIEDNMVVREALEVEMARRVIQDELLDADVLEEFLAAQRAAIARGDVQAFLAADEDFHMALLEAAGNAYAVETARRAWLHVNRVRYLVPMSPSAMREAMRDHRAIVAAIRDGSTARCQRSIREHLEEPLRRLLRTHAALFPGAFKPQDSGRVLQLHSGAQTQ